MERPPIRGAAVVAAAVVAAASVSLAVLAPPSAAERAAGGSAPPSADAVATTPASSPGRRVLLDAQRTTVLGQPIVYPTSGRAEISSSIITLPPGKQTGRHRHDAPMYAYVLAGQVTVTYDGGTTRVYRAGRAIVEAVGTVHNGVSTGRLPARLLVVNVGAEGTANSVTVP